MDKLKDSIRLIHFTSIDSLIKILITDSIRFSNVELVNDSYEFSEIYLGETRYIDDNDYLSSCNLSEKEYERNLRRKAVANGIVKYKKNIYLACFYKFEMGLDFINSVDEEEIYRNSMIRLEDLDAPSMWAHYGNQNKGVAIIFDKNELIKLFSEQFNNENFKGIHRDIDYVDGISKAMAKEVEIRHSIFEVSENINNEEELKVAQEEILNDILEYYFTKHYEWNVEKEYRFLILDKKDTNGSFKLLEGINKAIKGIVFGMKTNESDINIIHEIFKLKDLNEIACINKREYNLSEFVKKYPKFYKEFEDEKISYKEAICKCNECCCIDKDGEYFCASMGE